jgi:hypothetical protein
VRAFYPELGSLNTYSMLKPRIVRKVQRALRHLGVSLPADNIIPPLLEKVPLRRWHAGRSIFLSAHRIDHIRLASATGVLLHFKYLQDFHDKVRDAVARRQYFEGASEYARYAAHIGSDPHWSLATPDSIRYESSRQLAELGLIDAGV